MVLRSRHVRVFLTIVFLLGALATMPTVAYAALDPDRPPDATLHCDDGLYHPVEVEIFEAIEYQGRKVKVCNFDGNLDGNCWGPAWLRSCWNDAISSVRVTKHDCGFGVFFYEAAAMEGAFFEKGGVWHAGWNDSNLHDNGWGDRISSIIFVQYQNC